LLQNLTTIGGSHNEGGLPPGVVNLVYGSGSVVGEYLASHPRIKFVGFTGSKEVGQKIALHAATLSEGQYWFKRTILELGGKNAIIVDSSADLEDAVNGVIAASFGYQGQKCSACSRAIILEDIYDQFVSMISKKTNELKVGPAEEHFTYGAVINKSAYDKILGYIQIGKQEGKLVAGGEALDEEGFFIKPTIFVDVDENARLAQEEIFGPVLSIIKAKNFDDALRIANNTIYGLTGGVYSKDPINLSKAKDEFYVGNLYLNRTCFHLYERFESICGRLIKSKSASSSQVSRSLNSFVISPA
jgi:1-pyrroline-5-carboxylate dehydrogenase